MASLDLIETKFGGLPAAIKAVLLDVFRSFIKDLRLGHPADLTPSENFGAHFYEATTPAIASTEFSIAHQFGRTPYLVLPVLDVNALGSRLVPLEVTRAADDKRIYLKSTVASAPITIFLEG